MTIQETQTYQQAILSNISTETPKDLFDLMEGLEAWADWEAAIVCKYMVDEGFITAHSKNLYGEPLYIKSCL